MAMGFGSIKRMMKSGDSVKDLIAYWFPEMITQFVFIVFPLLVDSLIVASLKSTTIYGALGTANNFLHMMLKLAEAIPIASVAIIGRHNGAKLFKRCGEDLGDSFWMSVFFGIMQFAVIFVAATSIYRFLGVPEGMISAGAPFLRLRSFGILLTFASLALLYFMRAIKNTRTPMMISLVGICAFVFFDYVLVFGKFGIPALGLYGAAIATIIQYSIVISLSIWYLLTKVEYKKYFEKVFWGYFSKKRAIHLLNISWPIMIDKASLAAAYIWLFKMLSHMGPLAITSFDVIKNLERFALLPAVAFAQVITFLVSNRLGANDPEGAKSTIKKILIIGGALTGSFLLVFCLKARFFISWFDPAGEFTHIAAPAFVLVSTLVVFDFIQLILAGALRGAGDVKTVMLTRFICCLFFFGPLAYFLSSLQIANPALKFALVYSSFYINTAIFGFIFMRRIMGTKWQKIKV